VSSYTIKSLLFELIPAAAEAAKEDYPSFSQRDLYYNCRNRYLNHPDRPYHREYLLKRHKDETAAQYEARREAARQAREPIDYKYFTTNVLRRYEREYGKIEGLIREPHGTFVEPHTHNSVELGTLEVAEYDFPEHSFDKILYVEKGTEKPKFDHERIAEKYDMAIIYGKGYATEAIHELLSIAEEGEYQLFIWHDADVDGYNIVRNLREEAENIPGFEIDIIDIGLTVEEALRIGCASEPFTDDDALPTKLVPLLNEVELEYFGERQLRFEINGINPPSQRMAYVEERLREHDIRDKYIPPEDELQELVAEDLEGEIAWRVGAAIAEVVDKDAIVTRVTEALRERLQIDEPAAYIREAFEEDPFVSWSEAIDDEHSRRAREARHDMAEMVRDAIVTRVTEAEETDDG
jgi:hypothetical protein